MPAFSMPSAAEGRLEHLHRDEDHRRIGRAIDYTGAALLTVATTSFAR
jgi:hypothetical protein